MGSVSTETVGAAGINCDPEVKTFLVKKMVTLRELPKFFVNIEVNQANVTSRKTNISKSPTISNRLDASIRL